jgi:hydrogenase expression/formation protein HypD
VACHRQSIFKQMKLIDEYRNPELVKSLIKGITRRAAKIPQDITIMEVCGSHTNAIGRFGIRDLLPDNIKLVSGPGCPVCVTSAREVDIAIFLSSQKNTLFTTFGDMLRVPGSNRRSLQMAKAEGADIRIVTSAADCIRLAEENPKKEIIFMGIGFETTSPTIASVVKTCHKKSIRNFSVFSVMKVMPPAIKILIDDPDLAIDGFLCPGHVSIITGTSAYNGIIKAGRSAVITGFEPVDILEGIYMILAQLITNEKKIEIQYKRAVSQEGNVRARNTMFEVLEPCDSEWRGIGVIPGSGLTFKKEYNSFNTLKRFEIPDIVSENIIGCSCGDILRGIKHPGECPLFKKACTPLNPVGPCMVSSEGTCATYYKYH